MINNIIVIIISTILFNIININNAEAKIINVSSCSSDDIQAAINVAIAGDKIKVPPGRCIWTNTLSWRNKNIELIGSGTNENGTIIETNMTAISSTVFNTILNQSSIAGFYFKVNAPGSMVFDMRGQGWRIHNNKIENISEGALYCVHARGENTGGIQPFGLIDNNYFKECRILVTGAGSFSSMNEAWKDASAIGTENAVYVENNIFDRPYTSNGLFIDGSRGAKWVFRYNTTNGAHNIHAHSLQADNTRGVRSWEVYGNKMINPSNGVMFLRGGTGMIFGNIIIGLGSYSIMFDNVRSTLSRSGFGLLPPTTNAGLCNGESQWDGNELNNGWPCRDQIGRGQDRGEDKSIIGLATSSEPAYIWLNRIDRENIEINVRVANGCDHHIKANRDYYISVDKFDGNSGVGCGLYNQRPNTCRAGAAYWATDQSCTYIIEQTGANPKVPIVGILYKCDENNQWVEHYKPLTYPHPIAAKVMNNNQNIEAPKNLKISNSTSSLTQK